MVRNSVQVVHIALRRRGERWCSLIEKRWRHEASEIKARQRVLDLCFDLEGIGRQQRKSTVTKGLETHLIAKRSLEREALEVDDEDGW